jgi:GT2 family glycosyltransferase/glycosyltransferase involved in cell wall biosynthesis
MVKYSVPPGVSLTRINRRPVLTTEHGGLVAIDAKLLALWELVEGKDLATILTNFNDDKVDANEVRAGLACLAEAGLIQRKDRREPETHNVVTGPVISIIIVAHNNLDWLQECIPSLVGQNYETLEILVIDNGSEDDTEAWLSSTYVQVNYQRLEELVSFAGAINVGVEEAKGEYFLLLNPDTRLAPDAVSEMYRVAVEKYDCAAVAAKLKLLWAPGFLNGLGNRVGVFSWGMDNGLGHLDLGQFDTWNELPSACFAAALITRKAWQSVGPLDEGFPMYYEDSEWSYRARTKGFKIYPAPRAVVYHAFGGRIPDGRRDSLSSSKLENVVYGRLRFTLKLLDGYFLRFLFSYLLADFANILRFFLTFKWNKLQAIAKGWNRIISDLSEISRERKAIQSGKVVGDEQLFGTQGGMPATLMWRGLPELTWDLIRNQYYPILRAEKSNQVPEFTTLNNRPKFLIISHDVIDEKMAGPGMRYLEMGIALSDKLDVTIAIPARTSLHVPEIKLVEYQENRPNTLERLVEDSPVVLITSFLIDRYQFLKHTNARIVVDLYNPFVLENLHYYWNEPLGSQENLNKQSVDITNQLARIGDFFICGNERQRDYWLGVLTANDRINPLNFQRDQSLRSLIDVVGIGFPRRELRSGNFLRGIHPLIPPDARIVLWGGGIWNWLDPLTLIKAWPQVVDKHTEARLVLLGTRHPNPDVPEHEMASKAQALAEEIGEKDRSIIFIEWISYQEREALLSEADIGVTLHPVHIETRYSIRTRMLDYFWAQIPVVVTDGDVTSDWVREFNLGEVVPPLDVEATARGLISILENPKRTWAPAFEPLVEKLNWDRVVAPLLSYCLQGSSAPDRQNRKTHSRETISPSGFGIIWARARFILRSEGWSGLSHRAWRYIQRKIAIP